MISSQKFLPLKSQETWLHFLYNIFFFDGINICRRSLRHGHFKLSKLFYCPIFFMLGNEELVPCDNVWYFFNIGIFRWNILFNINFNIFGEISPNITFKPYYFFKLTCSIVVKKNLYINKNATLTHLMNIATSTFPIYK